ncbi:MULTISPECIES: helix-turn-helix domain-containing protein [Acinetobacter]|uniref:Helix-turn-helix domain-containing protein n=1 Tax=Acinetobacter junii TaxID=40215 RepID=A0AAW5R5G2_ACIJU|nr:MULTISPECIES: helix-turn-helix domain-containing protein [Acinetobacter]MCR4529887.1 helix-turn-helix domain-containing protein [Acinetobacter venetianus]MCU4395938.1 helix-turn-helix domain-containing protein [Acinetobacter junii]
MSTVKSAEKVLKVLKALTGHSLAGVTNQELAKQLDEPPAQITRALQTLVAEGFAQQLDDGTYALGNRFIAIAHAHSQEIEKAQGRLSEHLQRVFAGVKQISGS